MTVTRRVARDRARLADLTGRPPSLTTADLLTLCHLTSMSIAIAVDDDERH